MSVLLYQCSQSHLTSLLLVLPILSQFDYMGHNILPPFFSPKHIYTTEYMVADKVIDGIWTKYCNPQALVFAVCLLLGSGS